MEDEEASSSASSSSSSSSSPPLPSRVLAENEVPVSTSSVLEPNPTPLASPRRKISHTRWLARRFSEEQEEDVLSYFRGTVPDPVPFSRMESVEEVHGQQQQQQQQQQQKQIRYPRLEEICMEEFSASKPMVPPRRRRVTASTLPPEADLHHQQDGLGAKEHPYLRRVRSATCFRGTSDHGSRDWWYENGFAGTTCDYCRSGHVPYEPCPAGLASAAAARDEPYGRYSWAPSAHASDFLMPSRSQTPSILQIPTEGGPMVLQLVLPRSANIGVVDDVRSGRDLREQSLTSVVTTTALDADSGDATRNQQLGAMAMDKDKEANVESGLGLGMGLYGAAQVAASAASASVGGTAQAQAPTPTSDKERAEIFKKNLTTMLSCIYALFILMLGCVVYVADLLQPRLPVAEVFTMYLTLLGTTWLVFLHFDIRKFLTSVRLWRRSLNQDNRLGKDNRGFEGGQFPDQHQPRVAPKSPTQTPRFDSYCFKTGRHSGSFYLKIGAAGFCFGHLIHEGLLLSRQIVYFSSNDAFRQQCADSFTLLLNIIHPVFSFYQLFIVFKYSNIVINRNKEMSRFAVMHIIAANLCFWVNTIIRETVEALQQKAAHHHELSTPAPMSATTTTPLLGFLRADRFGSREHEEDDDDDDDDDRFFFRTRALQLPFQTHNATLSATNAHDGHHDVGTTILAGFLNSTRSGVSDVCVSRTVLSSFTIQAAPYLYPFTIEYSLLMAGIWFIIWYNIGNVDQNVTDQATTDAAAGTSAAATSSPDHHQLPENFSPGNMVIHVDCHSSNRGLFAGLLILLATVVSVIVFFVAMTNTEYIHTGIIINNVSDTVLELLMVISVVLAYRQTARLDFNKHAVTFLDDILLFIALPCFFLLAIFNVVAGIAASGSTFSIVISALSVIQVTLQTPFIIDGLRRCSNSYSLRYRKPGRELITFLVVCNLAAWILETFEIKSFDTQKDRIEYYGIFLWTLLSHATVPLTLFYRFHSSVCLVDMWKSAYEAGEAE